MHISGLECDGKKQISHKPLMIVNWDMKGPHCYVDNSLGFDSECVPGEISSVAQVI